MVKSKEEGIIRDVRSHMGMCEGTHIVSGTGQSPLLSTGAEGVVLKRRRYTSISNSSNFSSSC